MPHVRRPGFSLFYDDVGPRDAPVVVLMPSFLCDGSMFEHMVATLATRYRVLNVDLRGHGRSSSPERAWSLDDQADDVAAVLDHAAVDRAVVGGLSQGGMTALRVARRHRRRVRALVLMDSSASAERWPVRARYMLLAWIYRTAGLNPLVAGQVLALMFSDGFRASHADTVRRHVDAWRRLDRRAVVHSIRAIAFRDDFVPYLAGIDVPTLVMVGTADRALPPERSSVIARAIRGASLVTVEGAGHLATIEQPEVTSRAVRTFLDGLELR